MRTSSLVRSTLVCAFAAAALAGCGETAVPSDNGDFPAEPLTKIASDGGALTIEVRTAPEQPPVRGLSDVQLTITGKDGKARDDLSVAASPWMPDMGHGASTKPLVKWVGEGRYVVSEVNMFMPGRWELLTKVTGPMEDSATVVFQIP
jgi:hypothetical protein